MSDSTETDVVVVGGGPCGSTVATLVAQQGYRVVQLERERFPRYQIGESLLPSTVQGICRLLGVSKELEEAGFPIKRGGTFRWGANPEPWTFSFGISPKFAGTAAPAYQVERMRFDQILLDNARRHGVDVREQHAVNEVIEEDGRVVGVRCTDADGARRQFRSRYVVDASGHSSRIHSQVGGKRQYSEFFRNLALFGYFTGGKRMPAPIQGNILAVAFSAGWFWYIPLSDELTSVGAVLMPEALDRIQGERDRERVLNELIAECPMIADFLADAQRVTSGPYGEIRVRKDYSYIQEKFWRPGLVLAGDAACFIDPVFSSGVHLATYGGLLAARSVNTVLRGGDGPDESALFEEFELRYRQEYARFHDFLVGFYDMHSDEQSYFWKAKKVTGNVASELQSFVDLVGGGSSEERALIAAGSYLDRSEDDIDEMAWTVAQAGARIQVQAATGDAADEQVPIRPGGLVPSLDGMHWSLPAPTAA